MSVFWGCLGWALAIVWFVLGFDCGLKFQRRTESEGEE